MTTGRLSEVARHLVLPNGIKSTGWPAVRDTCERLGWTFDPWQDGAGRSILAKRADGLYAADTAVISIPRQVGKTFLIGAITFALCIKFPNTLVIWTAHRFKTARETFLSLKGMALLPSMAAHVRTDDVTSGAGNEVVGFRNGSRIMFGARERGFGRGFSMVDVLMLDEAQILSSAAMADMVPTTNQSPNPLILLTGTPPRPDDQGEVFTQLRREAIDGESEDVLYLEFSADPGADPLDRQQWAKANPSYPKRTPARAILRMRKNLTPDSFMREGLGVWDELAGPGRKVGVEAWEATARDVRPTGAPHFFVTIATGMRSASIAIAAREQGVPHVEIAARGQGVAWLTDRARELKRRYPDARFGAYAAGPAKAWVPTFAEDYTDPDGVAQPGFSLDLLTVPETVAACAHLQHLTDTLGLTHSPDDDVTNSLAGAQVRTMDGGGWVWDWRTSTSDLAPVAAETGALWLLEQEPEYDLLDSLR